MEIVICLILGYTRRHLMCVCCKIFVLMCDSNPSVHELASEAETEQRSSNCSYGS